MSKEPVTLNTRSLNNYLARHKTNDKSGCIVLSLLANRVHIRISECRDPQAGNDSCLDSGAAPFLNPGDLRNPTHCKDT